MDKWAPVFEAVDHYGAMHIVVDDWNLDDENIEFCMSDARLTDQEKSLALALLSMSEGQRWATAIRSEQPEFHPCVFQEIIVVTEYETKEL